MNFVNIESIRRHKFVGNAHSDEKAFAAICSFADNYNNELCDRAEALRIMAKQGMGLSGHAAGDNLSDGELVASYILSKE
jgi:hypothetical protein